MYAPIVIFVYNRKDYIKRLINSLRKNNLSIDSEVYIFSDGYKNDDDKNNVLDVRTYLEVLKKENYFKKIIIEQAQMNNGLAKSVISGVSKVIRKYGRVIVLEDDLVVSTYFLDFMNNALSKYENEPKVWSVSGFTRDIPYLQEIDIDIYFSQRAQSWSWGTWLNRWDKIDWDVKDYKIFKRDFKMRRQFNEGGNDMSSMLDRQQCGRINSWAIRFCYAQFKNHSYTVQPRLTLVQNKGQDGSGTNCNYVREYSELSSQREWKFREFCEDKNINIELKRTRKKIPYWKLMGSYFVYVICRNGNMIIDK